MLRQLPISPSATSKSADDDVVRGERDDAVDDQQAVLEDERLKQTAGGQSVWHCTSSAKFTEQGVTLTELPTRLKPTASSASVSEAYRCCA